MKERRCFNCHKIGHNARDCRSKNEGSQYNGVKKTAATTRAMIRNLVKDMDDGEKSKLLEEVVEEGF